MSDTTFGHLRSVITDMKVHTLLSVSPASMARDRFRLHGEEFSRTFTRVICELSALNVACSPCEHADDGFLHGVWLGEPPFAAVYVYQLPARSDHFALAIYFAGESGPRLTEVLSYGVLEAGQFECRVVSLIERLFRNQIRRPQQRPASPRSDHKNSSGPSAANA